MKRFEFKLQSLLNYKKHLEEMARQEMARAAADVNVCEQRIRELGEEREHAVCVEACVLEAAGLSLEGCRGQH